MRLKGIFACLSAAALLALAPAFAAPQSDEPPTEQQPAPEAQPSEPTPAQPETAQPEATPEPPKKKAPFALYVEAGVGSYDVDDIDPSIQTLATHFASSSFLLDPEDVARVAIGWRLNRGRGDLRLIFNGYSETGYTLDSTGQLAAVQGDSPDVRAPLDWWYLTAKNGALHAERWPPMWSAQDDANGNGFVDPGEQRYTQPDLVFDSETYPNMLNRVQTWDLVFGNVWGPRWFQGRWFGGFRYFVYDGNIPATAWLSTQTDGVGFTDGSLVRVLNFNQQTTGLGPTGLMEARFNFFDQVFQLYLNGQATFIVLNIDMDSGEFFSLIQSTSSQNLLTSPAHLSESQSKSTWQTGAEAGFRIRLHNGLKLEVGYGVVGFLDTIMLPTEIRIPANAQEGPQGVSAIYNTQDYVMKGWHSSLAFQF